MRALRKGVVEEHYLLCPFCGGRQNLKTRRCDLCSARPLAIVWLEGEPISPELVLVSR